jgi:hypothetical protein
VRLEVSRPSWVGNVPLIALFHKSIDVAVVKSPTSVGSEPLRPQPPSSNSTTLPSLLQPGLAPLLSKSPSQLAVVPLHGSVLRSQPLLRHQLAPFVAS